MTYVTKCKTTGNIVCRLTTMLDDHENIKVVGDDIVDVENEAMAKHHEKYPSLI